MSSYNYVYAEILTGYLHLEEDHKSLGHTEEDCYALKSQEVTNLSEPEVEEWQQKLKEEKDKSNPDMIDHIQLDKDFNAWLDKRQIELYGENNGKQ